MEYNFDDAVASRKLNVQMSRLGLGVHAGHEILLFDLGDATTCSEEIQQVLLDLAIIHYELDFAVASVSGDATLPLLDDEDNVYFVKQLNQEQEAYLQHISAMTITPNSVDLENVEEYKKGITAQFAREGFLRNETSRPGVFRVVPQNQSTIVAKEGDTTAYTCSGE